jgi:Ran GTPase-activating protein (RanGAP) involved in mRNA processing and transport
MSDTDSDADSISDASNVHVAAGGDEALISVAVRELCNELRANDPRLLGQSFTFKPHQYISNYSEAECIAFFQALKENTSVKHIDFIVFQGHYTARSALAAAEYVESSKTLKTITLWYGHYFQEVPMIISAFLWAVSRNTSVTKLIIDTDVVRFASVAFQELLTCMSTLQKLQIVGFGEFDELQIVAITSGFASNTTLRDLELNSWREADLALVLTALQDHPTLQKIKFTFREKCLAYLPSLSGLEVLLRSQDSKVKELILDELDTRTVGLHAVFRELERNTTVTKLAIRDTVLSRGIAQQLNSMLRRNTALQHLDLDWSALGNAGLAEIAPALYRNTSIKSLDLSDNGLDDIESANVLRELIRRNKSITSLCFAYNSFGRNAAAARSILEGVRSNTALQQLGLHACGLGDQGISLLVNALVARNVSTLELGLSCNEITSVGVRALIDNGVEAVKTLTKLRLSENPAIRSEGASILADALEHNAMPSLKRLYLISCGIEDDGFVDLVSALEQNTSLQIIDLKHNDFGERGFMALAKSLPNIKGLQEIHFTANASFQSTLPLLLQGFQKNTSLVEVNIDVAGFRHRGEWLRELQFLGQRNRFTPLLKASDPPTTSPQLGIWSRALTKVATEPDVLFHVLRNKPKLVESAGGSKKRKRDGE